jgi:hypothetical protein
MPYRRGDRRRGTHYQDHARSGQRRYPPVPPTRLRRRLLRRRARASQPSGYVLDRDPARRLRDDPV